MSGLKSKLGMTLAMPMMVIAFQSCDGGFWPAANLSAQASSGFAGTVDSDPVLKQQATAVLQTKCASCHQTGNSGGVTQILDLTHLVASGLITPGDSTAGRLLGSIQGGTMPPPEQLR